MSSIWASFILEGNYKRAIKNNKKKQFLHECNILFEINCIDIQIYVPQENTIILTVEGTKYSNQAAKRHIKKIGLHLNGFPVLLLGNNKQTYKFVVKRRWFS